MITQAELKERLHYDPDTGVFTWLKKGGGFLSKTCGHISAHGQDAGYVRIAMGGKKYRAHRLAWLYVYGSWPELGLDHINRIKADNRIANLREATPLENGRNATFETNPASGLKGVWKPKHTHRWAARIFLLDRSLNLGYYDTPEEAHAAYKKYSAAIHGSFYRDE
jgi:hypothetical protein